MVRKMRSIEKAYKEYKELDPNTDITEWFIRVLVRDNKIYTINTGRKCLLDLNSLVAYINGDVV